MHFLMSKELAKQYTMKGKPGESAPRRAFDQTRTYEVLVVALARKPNDVELNDVKNMLDTFLRKADTENKTNNQKKIKNRRSRTPSIVYIPTDSGEDDGGLHSPLTKRPKTSPASGSGVVPVEQIID